MKTITIDEENKKKIQKYIEKQGTFYGFEDDISLLEQENNLTEELARKVFSMSMNDAQRIRSILTPEENNEFKEEINEAYLEYDKIQKPEQLEKFGFYEGSYSYMEMEDIYSNMQIAFKLMDLDKKYYECRDLRNIANTAINSIDGVDKYKIEIEPEAKEELQRIKEELKNLLAQDRTDVNAIQDKIDIYNSYALGIWNRYLTDVNDVQNDEYRWLVHNLSKGQLEGEFRDKYMSTSIMTNNVMGLYGSANYGLIVKPKHIVSANYKDTYTFNYKEAQEDIFNIKPPVLLPQEIEEICIRKTIEANGEMLNYDKKAVYPEIVIDEYEIKGIYYVSYGEKELARDYEKARKIAEQKGLPLIERDISKYRVQHGLEPMTRLSQKNFCGNILRICCEGNKQLEEALDMNYHDFVEEDYKNFYEKYMELKQKGNFSREDILRVFSETTKNGQFNKIFENIHKAYSKSDETQQENNLVNEIDEDSKTDVYEENKGDTNQNNIQNEPNIWMNRFKFWCGAIDRISETAKPRFITIKLDIVNEINDVMNREIER